MLSSRPVGDSHLLPNHPQSRDISCQPRPQPGRASARIAAKQGESMQADGDSPTHHQKAESPCNTTCLVAPQGTSGGSGGETRTPKTDLQPAAPWTRLGVVDFYRSTRNQASSAVTRRRASVVHRSRSTRSTMKSTHDLHTGLPAPLPHRGETPNNVRGSVGRAGRI